MQYRGLFLTGAAKGVSHDIKREKSDGDGSSRTLDPDTSSASLPSLSLLSPSPSLSLTPQQQPSTSPSQSSDQKKSHLTPSTLPKSLSKSQSGTRRRAGSSSQQSSPVTTRFRAQTTFETVSTIYCSYYNDLQFTVNWGFLFHNEVFCVFVHFCLFFLEKAWKKKREEQARYY